jgi:hypothetical protein
MNLSPSRIKLLSLALLNCSLAGCGASGGRSPSVDVLGAYFPAWMICIYTGLALTLIARQIFIALKLDSRLRPALLVYASLLMVFSLAVWLVFYKN